MTFEEAEKVVREQLVTISPFWSVDEDFGFTHRKSYQSDDKQIEVVILDGGKENEDESNIFLNFRHCGIDIDLTAFNATIVSVKTLFATYLEIVGR